MALRTDYDRLAARRSSQLANPFTDQPDPTQGGMSQTFTPPQAGGFTGGRLPGNYDQATTPVPASPNSLGQRNQGLQQAMQRAGRQGESGLDGMGGVAPTAGMQQALGITPPQQSVQDLIASTARRGGGTGQLGATIGSIGGGIGAGAGAGALMGTGTALGAKLGVWGGPIGMGIGALGGMLGGLIGGAVNRKAASAPSDFATSDAQGIINAAYQQALGRAASPEEVATHLQNIGLNTQNQGRYVGQAGLGAILDSIEQSPEAAAYTQRQNAPPSPTLDPGVPQVPAPASNPSVQPGAFSGRLQGFDSTKLADSTHNTPKYVFARHAANYDTRTPEGRAQLLVALQADPSGYFTNANLGGSKGDILSIGGQLDPQFGGISQFDVFQGAGAGTYAPTWQPLGEANTPSAQVQPGQDLTSTTPNFFPSATYNPKSAIPNFGLNSNDPNWSNNILKWLMQQLAMGNSLGGR